MTQNLGSCSALWGHSHTTAPTVSGSHQCHQWVAVGSARGRLSRELCTRGTFSWEGFSNQIIAVTGTNLAGDISGCITGDKVSCPQESVPVALSLPALCWRCHPGRTAPPPLGRYQIPVCGHAARPHVHVTAVPWRPVSHTWSLLCGELWGPVLDALSLVAFGDPSEIRHMPRVPESW